MISTDALWATSDITVCNAGVAVVTADDGGNPLELLRKMSLEKASNDSVSELSATVEE